jgi:hypothetical protein
MSRGKRALSLRMHVALVAMPVAIALAVGCGSGGGRERGDGLAAATAGDVPDEPGAEGAAGSEADTPPVADVVVDAADFRPLADMTAVRGFFVDNVAGDLDATLAVARDPGSGPYPVGSLIQLIPQEAMVKRAPGFDPASNDWEFFTLDTTAAGTRIVTRGGSEVVNRFTASSCAGCHSAADAEFDLVCEDDHGCAPLPVGDDIIAAIQAADPRPRV